MRIIFKNKSIISAISFTAAMLLLSLVIAVFTELTVLSSLRIVFGSFYVLFLPGFIITYIFFQKTDKEDIYPENKHSIDILERIALSFALSIAIVPLTVFYLNLIGIRINLLNSFLTILFIIIISIAILFYKNKRIKYFT